MHITRNSNRQERDLLRKHVVRMYRSGFKGTRAELEDMAHYMVGMADISVIEFERKEEREFDRMIDVCWHDGPCSAQAFLANGKGSIKALWYDKKPNPAPDLRERVRLFFRFVRTVILDLP